MRKKEIDFSRPLDTNTSKGTEKLQETYVAATTDRYEFYTAKDVQEYLGIGRTQAYDIIKQLNQELEAAGKFTFAGKVPKAFLIQHLYQKCA